AMGALALQDVEDCRRILSAGPIIEGERQLLGLLARAADHVAAREAGERFTRDAAITGNHEGTLPVVRFRLHLEDFPLALEVDAEPEMNLPQRLRGRRGEQAAAPEERPEARVLRTEVPEADAERFARRCVMPL